MTHPTHLSKSTEWKTPDPTFDPLHAKYRFTYDPAAQLWNAKVELFSSPKGTFIRQRDVNGVRSARQLDALDGLKASWQHHRIFLNPPYGRTIGKWVEKAAFESSISGSTCLVIALLPARTGTKWWHEWVLPYADIEYTRGRLHFVREDGKTGAAPYDSALARYR